MPVPAAYDTREFRLSDGPGQHNAVVAWQAGHSGKGVTIAVVDSGIDPANPEFAGRLAAASRDMYDSRATQAGSYDHGTRVAQVAAGARDGAGVLGMAWNATILALRADQPGSCDGAAGATGCSFTDAAIAQAVSYAADNGAKVINISLGGGSADSTLTDAVRAATAKGALVVVAAGNDSLEVPTDFTTRLAAAGAGAVLVVGAVDESGQLASFSNRAGGNSAGYLAARGQAVCCSYQDGQIYTDQDGYLRAFSGTSFAAPQVSGAAALLAQAFPHLTGQQLAAVLLESAHDAGAPGPDAVYGSGILDVARAFRPLGATALAGQATPLAPGEVTGSASGPMGDAFAALSLPVLVTDKYARAFATDLGAGLRGAGLAMPLHGALAQPGRIAALASEQVSLALAFAAPRVPGAAGLADPASGTSALLDPMASRTPSANLLSARASLALAPDTQLDFAWRLGGELLAAQLRGRPGPSFLLSATPADQSGTLAPVELALGLRQRLGPWGLTLSAERGAVPAADPVRVVVVLAEPAATRRLGAALDRDFGPFDAVLGLSWLAESDTLLGARLHQAFGLAGADTLFLDAAAGWQLAPGWRLGAALRRGFTRARDGGLVAPGTRLASDAWSLDLARRDVLAAGDTLALRVSQPLRVGAGELALALPRGWDYATLTAATATQRVALAPSGRELTAELAWSGSFLAGDAAASLFYRRQPGHYAGAPADAGIALRWSRGF